MSASAVWKTSGQSERPDERHAAREASCATITLSKPLPTNANANVAGMMPSTVAAANGASRTPPAAETRLTSQNGNTGMSRRKSR